MARRPVVVAALLALVVLWAAAAEAAAPVGPRLAFDVFRPYPGDLGSIETVGPSGEDRLRVVENPISDRPAWSPDGSLLAFTDSFGELSPVPYVVGAEGGEPRLVSKKVTPLSSPIFSADGRWLVFLALRVVKGHFERPRIRARRDGGVVVNWAIWSVSLDGKSVRKVTGWKRRQMLVPISYSPDGRYLAAERYDGRRQDAVLIDLRERDVRVIARNADEPVFSPDGSKVAFVRTKRRRADEPGERSIESSSLLVAAASLEEAPKRIVRIRGGLAWPSWDPSGSRIAFTRLNGGGLVALPDEGNSVMQVNVDGSCLSRLLSIERGHYEGVAWQPGPDRGAGPIAC